MRKVITYRVLGDNGVKSYFFFTRSRSRVDIIKTLDRLLIKIT